MSNHTDPFRLRVLKAMTEGFKTITPGNGYHSDLSDDVSNPYPVPRVYRGIDEFGQNHPLPMISILENPRALDLALGNQGEVSSGGWELLIQGFVKDDRDNPTDPAYVLAADVVKYLVTQKRHDITSGAFGFGPKQPCITKLEWGNPVCRPADGMVSDTAQFWLPVTLYLVEDPNDPYA